MTFYNNAKYNFSKIGIMSDFDDRQKTNLYIFLLKNKVAEQLSILLFKRFPKILLISEVFKIKNYFSTNYYLLAKYEIQFFFSK